MNKLGPIVVIEDDMDDQYMLAEIFKTLDYGNEVVFFSDGERALEYFNRTEIIPFIILSDVNMPRVGGFELRNSVHTNEKLSIKCIPYIFFTTAASKNAVIEAYSMSVQGFFVKPSHYDTLLETIRTIITYWQLCYSPNSIFES